MHIQQYPRECLTLTEKKNVVAMYGKEHMCTTYVLLVAYGTLSTCYALLYAQQGHHCGLCICRSKICGTGQAHNWLPAGLLMGGGKINMWWRQSRLMRVTDTFSSITKTLLSRSLRQCLFLCQQWCSPVCLHPILFGASAPCGFPLALFVEIVSCRECRAGKNNCLSYSKGCSWQEPIEMLFQPFHMNEWWLCCCCLDKIQTIP